MNNILIVSDSYTEHMATLSFPFYKHLIDTNIDIINLLSENHTHQEAELLRTLYPVTLVENIRELYSNYVLIFGDNNFFKRIGKYIKHSDHCIFCPNPWKYNTTDLTLTKKELELVSDTPTILLLTFSDCSSIVNIELLLNKVFDEKKISGKKFFLPSTYNFLCSMYNYDSLELEEEIELNKNPKVIIKSVYWNEEIISTFSQSEIVSFIEKINPDYTILCLDGDKNNNQLHVDTFTRLFGKLPNLTIASAYYDYLIGGQQLVKVYSKDCCQNNSMYEKNDILEKFLYEEIISKMSLPNNVHIL